MALLCLYQENVLFSPLCTPVQYSKYALYGKSDPNFNSGREQTENCLCSWKATVLITP